MNLPPAVDKITRIAEESVDRFPGGPSTNAMLECIAEHVATGMRTVETGCGRTTGVFVGAGCIHDFVEIRAKKAKSLIDALTKHDMSATGWIGDSVDLLPRLVEEQRQAGAVFGFALMDGCDASITTVSDAICIHRLLGSGAYLLIDDVEHPWVKHAIAILLATGQYEKVTHIDHRALLFRKS